MNKNLLKQIMKSERSLRQLRKENWKLRNQDRIRCKSCPRSHRTPYRCSRCKEGTCNQTSFLLCLACKTFLVMDSM